MTIKTTQENDTTPTLNPAPGYVDAVDIELGMHLLIKDADTNMIILNQRG